MKIGPARSLEAEYARVRRVFFVLRECVRRRNHFDRVAAGIAEFAEQPSHVMGGYRVASWVRQHRLAAGAAYPFDGLRERRPRVRNVAGLSAHEIAFERVAHIAHASGLGQKSREM